jgi:hypothetical protein
MRGKSLILVAAAFVFTAACESSTENKLTYKATLTGANEVPAVTTSGTGTWTGTLDSETNIMTYTLTFSGLNSNSTLAHIHGPGAAGVIAGVLVNFDASASGRTITLGATSGTGSGSIDLSPTAVITSTVTGADFRAMLDAGTAYVNVHSATSGGGEIRGQITKQ